jgi:hypothetical protein
MILPVKDISFLLGIISVFEFCDILLPYLPGQKKISSNMNKSVLKKIKAKSYKYTNSQSCLKQPGFSGMTVNRRSSCLRPTLASSATILSLSKFMFAPEVIAITISPLSP